jgi:hypothetical protein
MSFDPSGSVRADILAQLARKSGLLVDGNPAGIRRGAIPAVEQLLSGLNPIRP